jgi:hypothetical protein
MKPGLLHLWMAIFLLSAVSGMAGGPAACDEIPDQRVLLHYSNGVETLVMDTTFKGVETNFAWVIPVPSRPEVQMATTGLFPTLEAQFYPEVVFEVFPYWIPIALFGGYLVSMIYIGRRLNPLLTVLIGIALFMWLSGYYTASLATSKHRVFHAGVNIVNRKSVGGFETVVLPSDDGSALRAWLAKNGFSTSSNMIPILHAYAAEGWCFVASKVSRSGSTGPVTPQPLILKFKTDHPVLPLRLTGSTEDSWTVHLYVFGPGRAGLPHFKTEICALPSYPLDAKFKAILRHGLVIRHPLLRQLVEGSPIATRLTGRLTRAQMQADGHIHWTPGWSRTQTLYGEDAATVLALNLTAGCFFAAWLILELFINRKRNMGGKVFIYLSLIALLSGLSWVAIYGSLSKSKALVLFQWYDGMDRWHEERGWVLAQHPTNTYTRQPLLEQDSPGNWTRRADFNPGLLNWYDWDGAPHPAPMFFDLFPKPSP